MKTSFKKLTSVVLAVLMLLSVFAVSVSAADTNTNSTGDNTVYFAPGEAATADPAWFAWTWDGVTDQWITGVQDGDYIRFDGCGNKIVFVRMPSGSTAGDWNTCWNQSEDLTISDNLATFSSWNNQKFNVTWSHYDGGETPTSYTSPTQSGDGITVTFNNTLGWSDVNVHYWNASGTGSTWPGIPMSNNGSAWTATIPADSTGVVFNTNGGAVQTADGNIAEGTDFSPTGDQDSQGHYVISAGGYTPTSYTTPTSGGSGDLYLFGTIGKTDFGSGETEWNQPTAYDITSGTLTTTFAEEAYVGVKKLSTNTWYMADGFPGMTATSATLYDADKFQLGANAEKLHVPAGVEVTFSFSENGDGTASLSYTTNGEIPTQDTGYTPTTPTQGGGTLKNKFVAVIYCEAFGTDDASRNKEAEFSSNGTLTYDFPDASYVFVRNYDTGVQYCTDGWSNFANPVTLVNQAALTQQFDKMYVPSGQHTLYLTDNGNDTFTLGYDTGGDVTEPTQTTEPQTQTTEPQTQATQTQATQTQQTQATETGSSDKLQASVKLNGTQVKVVDVTKSTLTVTYNLTADKLITDGDFALSYDSSKLTLSSVSTPAITGGSIAQSNINANPYLVNFTGVNQSTHSGIYNFKSGAVFVTAVFNVTSGAKGTAAVNLEIKELDGLESDVTTSYFADSQITTAGQTLLSSLSNPTVDAGDQPTQTQSQPTQASSETQGTTPTQASSETQGTTPTQASSETQATTPTQASSETQATTPTQASSETQATQTPTQASQTTIKLSCSKKTIYVNATTIVKATVSYGVGSTTFKSSNTKVATVNAAGQVKGKKAGTVTISVRNNGKVATIKIKVVKRANPMTVKAKTVKAKANKKTVIKKSKAFTIKKAKGKVVFKKVKGDKKITINKKTGKITVKKGLKKGKTYKLKVKVTAKGNTAYKAKSKTVTVKIKVTK